ncbi:hypothetical protein MUK42_13422 [Musa troglodytarum]|uniref:Uncharacterized protein n=1 Tax=Musa troglodytarum TaxID=320322 RepID=A0A9E7G8K9_9LILI|nr:hypothetical protein MUK42_13422 [Musa troglodytarum]
MAYPSPPLPMPLSIGLTVDRLSWAPDLAAPPPTTVIRAGLDGRDGSIHPRFEPGLAVVWLVRSCERIGPELPRQFWTGLIQGNTGSR